MVSINFSKNWLYQKTSSNSKAACFSQFSERDGFPFHWAVKKVVDAYDIPDDLVINIDEIPLPFILLSKYTMDKKNEKLVSIANSAGYCQITVTFSISLSGIFLPMQIIYQGQTDCRHSEFKFPEEFNSTKK